MVSTAGGIIIAIVVLLLAAAIGWIVFTQLRARRLGVRASVFPSSPRDLISMALALRMSPPGLHVSCGERIDWQMMSL